MAKTLTSRDWFGKTLAATLLGFLLAIGISGLWAWFGPGGIRGGPVKMQINMWMVPLWWGLVCSLVFFFPNPRAAWGWLGLANLAVWGTLLAGQQLIG